MDAGVQEHPGRSEVLIDIVNVAREFDAADFAAVPADAIAVRTLPQHDKASVGHGSSDHPKRLECLAKALIPLEPRRDDGQRLML